MKIDRIEINHLEEPVGFDLSELLITPVVSGISNGNVIQKRIQICDNRKIVYSENWKEAENLNFKPLFKLVPQTEYQVEIGIRNNNEEITRVTKFETGLMGKKLAGKWMGCSQSRIHSISCSKEFVIDQNVNRARLYITGLGLYEVYLDNRKIGNEFLTPGFTNYNYYVERNTYVLDGMITPGKHKLTILLGDGWYRGKIGITTHGGEANTYGNKLLTCAQLSFWDDNGEHVIGTNNSWNFSTTNIKNNGIYYGEDIDMTGETTSLIGKEFPQPSKYVRDRLGVPITKHERFKPCKMIKSPDDDGWILDFGQNMAGWVEFTVPEGVTNKITIEYAETMQDGDIYRKNLRSARAKFVYKGDGTKRHIRPHFTYFGFRYVKVKGLEKIKNNFIAFALYANLRKIGSIRTDNVDVNQLISNVQWGQRSNFLSIPTDCPQRDERLGWTGDAQIFAKTASYNMEVYPFFKKYAYDMAVAQSRHNGMLPLYVPTLKENDGGKAGWSDAATIIPWIMYYRTGDTSILQQNIGAMMSWVDWIHDKAKSEGNEFLWQYSDQLGDWLALDTEDIMQLKGKTEDDLIASAFYYASAQIVSKAAKLLNYHRETNYYGLLAGKVKEAFIDEFFTKSGRFTNNTQTGLALVLTLGLYPKTKKQELVKKLVLRIGKNGNHLQTGFIGTPLLLPVLSQNGYHELACQIFLNHDYPGWLFQVDHGATTIWERWNSIDSNGRVVENGMNSLNHYSNGSVMQWLYEYLAGIKQSTNNKLVISPQITAKFKKVEAHTEITDQPINVKWKLLDNGNQVEIGLNIPYGYTAQVILPRTKSFNVDGKLYKNGELLSAGQYTLSYKPLHAFVNACNIDTPLKLYLDDEMLCEQLAETVPFWGVITSPVNREKFKEYSLRQLSNEVRGIGFKPLSETEISSVNNILGNHSLGEK